MSKQIINRYSFDPAARKVTFLDFSSIKIERLALITNLTTNTVIFNFADYNRRGTVVDNVVTLNYDTTTMLATDPLRIDYDTLRDDGLFVADIASEALTTTATSSSIISGTANNAAAHSHTFSVVVTAVSGTSPTLDIAVEESPDNGTNWIRVYEFPRITATGTYVTPRLRATFGTRFRYVRTVGGTTPSFTMSLNRIQWGTPGELTRQWFDRTISLTTANSATPIYNVDGCNFFQVAVNLGAATTPPVLQLQGSEDDSNWYNIGAQFTPAASTTTIQVVKDFVPKFARVIVATAGATVTPGYISLKALGA